jgi:transketolase
MTEGVNARLKRLRRNIIQAAFSAREGHIASAFSILDLLWVSYDRVLRSFPGDPKNEGRDRFILSKGHGSLGLYAVLAEKGFFSEEELSRFARFDSRLGGHPDANKVPGVEASTGSLGHGLPMAVGMAIALRLRGSERRIVVLMGDGECNEGPVWEGALLAAHHRLASLTCIIDDNHSTDRALRLGDIAAKFAAFEWSAAIIDGHDHEAIYNALARPAPDRPTVIVAETVKGRGCPLMENNPAWHHRVPTPEELPSILQSVV